MRAFCLFFFSLLPSFALSLFGQIGGYKYIYINPLNNPRVDNAYGITSSIANDFISKGLILISSENQNNIPSDLRINPCLLIIATPIYDDSPIRGIRLKLNIKNCNNEKVFAKEASAKATFLIHEAFKKALRKMSTSIEAISYQYDPKLTPKISSNQNPEYAFTGFDVNVDSVKKYLDENAIDGVEGIYKSYRGPSDNSLCYKIAIIKKKHGFYEAVILESETPIWKPGEIKMAIENTATKDVFSIQYYMQDKSKIETFASLGEGTFVTCSRMTSWLQLLRE